MILKRGDIFLVHGKGFVPDAIRLLTRRIGERRSRISHVGLIVAPGDLDTAMAVEALKKVRHAPFKQHIGETLEVFRPENLTPEETDNICARAMSYVGKTYGYLKILTHTLDGLLMGAYVFRRFTNVDAYPICSWLVAHAYLAAGKDFGVPAGAATPDDIEDFIRKHPDKYSLIHPLRPLGSP
jgi:hypothetical protein